MEKEIVRVGSFNALKEAKLLGARAITYEDVAGEVKARRKDERAYWNDILHEYELHELEEIRAILKRRKERSWKRKNK